MGNLNDFKNVYSRAKEYSKFLNLDEKQREIDGARFGFYLLALECITDITDIDEIKEMIVDTEFRSTIYNEKNNDLGIDAVNINREEKTIQLFNFKFREKFKIDKGQALGDMLDGVKFLLAINSENRENIVDNSPISAKKIESISEALESDEPWEFIFYMVSNDNRSLSLEDPSISNFKENYGMTVSSIILDDIVSYISELPDDLTAKFVINSTSVMTYEEDELSSSKSYLIKLSLADLIRITCNNDKLRNTLLEDYSILEGQELEMSLLFDNVRGYLGEKTKFNKNIINTIRETPNKFFMFNNGLTITTKNIEAGYLNGRKKFECKINGFQIVNGGQTLRTIYEFCKSDFDDEKLANAEILVRLFQTASDKNLTNNIAEYTNSQNAISSKDLKSISTLQIQLETHLKTNKILYVRKSGNIGDRSVEYKRRISMEKLAQILYTDQGFPDRATNQKKALFEKYYDDIFNDSLDFDKAVVLIERYHNIELEYSEKGLKGTHQKYLYILYLMDIIKLETISNYIDYLEKEIGEYKKDEQISSARKLIQKGFKEHLIKRTPKD